MQIRFCSVLVKDQVLAFEFYTKVLGFRAMADIPMGEYRFLTVCSSEAEGGAEIVLEPVRFQPAAAYQTALYEAGIPMTALTTMNIEEDVGKLKKAGVSFRGSVRDAGPIKTILFEDTCGNLINLVQPK
jgi:catechol 2,3-dioxygenase-like lactoylglutathione lyase family enzyme